jgi:hypothetical protein
MTLLPSTTNSRIAAAVAQVVMMWLLAMRTVLLRTLVSALSTHWSRAFGREK